MYKKRATHVVQDKKIKIIHHHIVGDDPNFETNTICIYFIAPNTYITLKLEINFIFFL